MLAQYDANDTISVTTNVSNTFVLDTYMQLLHMNTCMNWSQHCDNVHIVIKDDDATNTNESFNLHNHVICSKHNIMTGSIFWPSN
jgi:hypothetical protein